MNSLDETIANYFSCLNHEDWDDFGRLWAPAATLSAVGARPRTGPDDISDFYRGLFRPWAVHSDIPTRVLHSGTSATVEVTFRGTTGDGRAVSFDAVDVFDFDAVDWRITRLTNWYDLVLVRKILESS